MIAAVVPEVCLRRFGAEDAEWLITCHRELYQRDEGFDASFAELVSQAVEAFLRGHDESTERGWIAWQDQQRIGSIFCTRSSQPCVARLRLFLLLPALRGLGLGRHLLEHCLDFARSAGYRRLVLSTFGSHQAACRLYARSGFTCTRSEPTLAFGRELVELDWERELIDECSSAKPLHGNPVSATHCFAGVHCDSECTALSDGQNHKDPGLV